MEAERDRLMDAISDVLNIPHFDKGVGSSVHNDFIDTVSRAILGDAVATAYSDKYRKIEAVITFLGGVYERADADNRGRGDTSEGTASGGGGTVTNSGLGKILDLLLTYGIPEPIGADDSSESAFEIELAVAPGFDPALITSIRTRRLAEVGMRPGASSFRNSVREAYGYRCCVTGADVLRALDVAHIVPYSGRDTDQVDNALLLRVDIHRLFDSGLLAIDPVSLEVIVSPALTGTTYAALAGRKITVPSHPKKQPSAAALRAHRELHRL